MRVARILYVVTRVREIKLRFVQTARGRRARDYCWSIATVRCDRVIHRQGWQPFDQMEPKSKEDERKRYPAKGILNLFDEKSTHTIPFKYKDVMCHQYSSIHAFFLRKNHSRF